MKKLNQKGFAHNLIVLIVLVLVVVGGSGYYVWSKQKDNSITAKAAGWAIINSRKDSGKTIQALACRMPAKTPSVKLMVVNTSTSNKVEVRYDISAQVDTTGPSGGSSSGQLMKTVTLKANKNSYSKSFIYSYPSYMTDSSTVKYRPFVQASIKIGSGIYSSVNYMSLSDKNFKSCW